MKANVKNCFMHKLNANTNVFEKKQPNVSKVLCWWKDLLRKIVISQFLYHLKWKIQFHKRNLLEPAISQVFAYAQLSNYFFVRVDISDKLP